MITLPVVNLSPTSGAGVDALAAFIERHKLLFVLTGAGCSTASGIPDYRAADGSWKRSQPVQYQDFVHGECVRRRYWARSLLGWPRVSSARPNASHYALARLQAAGYMTRLVTQNVDGLHQRAGSREVIDLHGRLDRVDCIGCGRTMARARLQTMLRAMNPGFAEPFPAAPDGDALVEDTDLHEFRVPACPACNGTLKPAVVFFGEGVPHSRVESAQFALRQANAMLVVGSSLTVFSGYRFCRAALEQGKPIAAINLGRTRADEHLTLKVTAECGDMLATVANCLTGQPDATATVPTTSSRR
jgi:NAD-dependent SIR2 family protein deacetylase